MNRRARILLVEDNEINQEVGLELLRQANFDVDLAENGAIALSKIESQDYDLVLMDIQMPQMGGIEACRELRRIPLNQTLPVVAMSANSMASDKQHCLDAGMNDFIAKPMEPEALNRMLLKWIPARLTPATAQHTQSFELGIDGIDSAAALRRMLGKTGLYCATLHKFCTLHENTAAAMRSALECNDWCGTSLIAHTLKGVADSIGANGLAYQAAELESALRLRRPRPEIDASIDVLDSYLRSLISAVRKKQITAQSFTSQTERGEFDRHVLVIDDSPEIRMIINELLNFDYHLAMAESGELGLKMAAAYPAPDLILLDIMMPGMSGQEVCRRLKADPATCDIPVIFLTAMNNDTEEENGFALGAVDYITKPISGAILRARVRTHVSMKLAADLIKDKNHFLTSEVSKGSRELAYIQDVTIFAMASLAETRDNETGQHLYRTQRHVRVLAEHLQLHPRFSRLLTRANIELICKSAPLHDIGKVGIPDAILLKPGKLTATEFEIMKTHATLGRSAIEKAEQQLGRNAKFLVFAKEITGSHQEKWDGSGYPEGLSGEQIPVSARLMALADVYDALVSVRAYKKPMTHEQASLIISQGRGIHFDPDIVDAFLTLQDKFKESAMQFQDHTEINHAIPLPVGTP